MSSQNITNLAAEIQLVNARHVKEPGPSNETRGELIFLAEKLITELQTPSEVLSRVGWAEPARFACMRTAVDLEVFQSLKDAGSKPLSSSELSEVKGADNKLMSRVLKHLAATGVIQETSSEHYISTALSNSLTEPRYRDGLIYLHDIALPSFTSMPNYLRETNYAHPTSIVSGPFQYAFKTTLDFFSYLTTERPSHWSAFTNYMSGYRADKPRWSQASFYDVASRLVQGIRSDPEAAALVGVGGGLGHDLTSLKADCPSFTGRIVLQDKPEVVSAAAQDDEIKAAGIETMAYDFFAPQPIKGARAYHMHSVLHDWPDEEALKILGQVRDAMEPGYSRLLIDELVVEDEGASWYVTSMDWLMLALGAVRERRDEEWRGLVEKAGLKISGVWKGGRGVEWVYECERVD